MSVILEFVRPHGWLSLIAMLVANGLLCYRFGGRVLFLTIPILGLVYGVLDVAWIRQEMGRPGWDGAPDQDAVFYVGMLLRVGLGSMLLVGSCIVAALISNRVRGLPLASDRKSVS
jgi:hypothetical protein